MTKPMKLTIDATKWLAPLDRAGARQFVPLTLSKSAKSSAAIGYEFVEGVHFDLSYTTPQEVGHKCLATALAQLSSHHIAADQVSVSLGLTQMLNEAFVTELLYGLQQYAGRHDVKIYPGNVFPSPTVLFIGLTLCGKVVPSKKSQPKPGDCIAVTGSLGASAAGLTALRKVGRGGTERHQASIKAHLRPEPRIKEALELARSGRISAMRDLSEGLATEINELLAPARLGATIEEKQIPVALTTHDTARLVTSNARLWALYGSEDYELLLTFAPKHRKEVEAYLKRRKTPLTVIGHVSAKKGAVILNSTAGEATPLAARSWNALVRRRR